MKHTITLLIILLLVPLVTLHAAELKLAAVFSQHMVLQRDHAIPVWGWAEVGEKVKVEFAKQSKQAIAGANGTWSVTLDAMPASAEPRILKVNRLEIADVLVGDVWVCGGQSNMERHLGLSPPQPPLLNWEQEVATADFPLIRHFGVAHKAAREPLLDVTGTWAVCSPQTVKDFTAVGYFFGRELVRELKVPIGLLHSSWGGTGLATWTSKSALDTLPEAKAEIEAALAQPTVGYKTPTILFQSMIAPLLRFPIKGVIWFQGESGTGLRVAYDQLFQVMIKDWRKHWGIGAFPFYFVQLPSGHPETREAQTRALQLPNTGMAITIDVGYRQDVHGPDKSPIGQRLARLALTQTYGRSGESSGPLFASAKVEANSIRIKFMHTGGGLLSKDGGPLKLFTIAGEDKKFVPAEASIQGDSVVVKHPKMTSPVAVRYAWAIIPCDCNLYGSVGIPAAPFRTDAW
jgi:sialate O-acetylesterase